MKRIHLRLDASELRAFAFVTTAVVMLVVFRQLLSASLRPQMSASAHAAMLWGDFLLHLVAAVIMVAIVQPARRLAPPAGAARVVTIAAALIAASAITATARSLWLISFDDTTPEQVWPSWHVMFIRFALLGGMLVAVGEFHRRQTLSLEAMRSAEADRAALEQQTLQARLKTLEAQIEPHFLFNILANVRRLYETDAVAGKAMLARLMAYLEVALPSMRDERATLGRELLLAEAYLDLQQVRMGRRLAYDVDVDPQLRPLEIPPMMLLTLVENAIKHGLAPQREGGHIQIGARIEGLELTLDVVDDGRGLGGTTSGGGTGVANIRARLAAMFGSAAELSLEPRTPRGLRAVIRLPVARSAGAQ